MSFVKKLCLIVLFLLFTCSVFAEKSWKKSIDNVYVYTDIDTPFEWTGDVIGNAYKFANGYGTIKTKSYQTESTDLYFGAHKEDFYKGKGVLFLCENDDIEGFGVVISNPQKGRIYTGNFSNRKLNGIGDIYEDFMVRYSGNIENNKKHGKGTEFQSDGTTISGTYRNGQKNGDFSIKTKNNKIIEIGCSNDNYILFDAVVRYFKGDVFRGELDENFELKHGILRYVDGKCYEGNFYMSKCNGYGEMTYTDGSAYYGNWVDDYQEGYGEYYSSSGMSYEGEWKRNTNGKGSIFSGTGCLQNDAFLYEGNFVDGVFDGEGYFETEEYTYEGEFRNGFIDGDGRFEVADGSYYEGSWIENERQGQGTYVWADGTLYSGNWGNNLPDGDGIALFSNGDAYDGDFTQGSLTGFGTYKFKNGDYYEGSFINNTRDGVGVYNFYSDGDYSEFYEGEFTNGLPDGLGIYTFSDTEYYEGNFSKGSLSGSGSLIFEDGNTGSLLTSNYWDGATLPKHGSFIFPNGDEFFGDLENGIPTENGVWTTLEERISAYNTQLPADCNPMLAMYYPSTHANYEVGLFKNTAEKARAFYNEHATEINTFVKKANEVLLKVDLVATGVSMAAGAVAIGSEALGLVCPPAAPICLAVTTAAVTVEKASEVIAKGAGLGMTLINSSVLTLKAVSYGTDFAEALSNGEREELVEIAKDFFKDSSENISYTIAPIIIGKMFGIVAKPLGKAAGKVVEKIAHNKKFQQITCKLENIGSKYSNARSGMGFYGGNEFNALRQNAYSVVDQLDDKVAKQTTKKTTNKSVQKITSIKTSQLSGDSRLKIEKALKSLKENGHSGYTKGKPNYRFHGEIYDNRNGRLPRDGSIYLAFGMGEWVKGKGTGDSLRLIIGIKGLDVGFSSRFNKMPPREKERFITTIFESMDYSVYVTFDHYETFMRII